jgi:hypothetical protein
VGRKPEAKPCTEEHEPHVRRDGLDELAKHSEVRDIT